MRKWILGLGLVAALACGRLMTTPSPLPTPEPEPLGYSGGYDHFSPNHLWVGLPF